MTSIISNGKANTIGNGVRVYPLALTKSVAVTGLFSGAKVTVEQSPNDKDWFPIDNLTDVADKVIVPFDSINGWLRVRIAGGTPFIKQTIKPEWRNSTSYPKDYECVIENKIYKSLDNHTDGMVPTWELWEYVSDYTPSTPVDNSTATSITVQLM